MVEQAKRVTPAITRLAVRVVNIYPPSKLVLIEHLTTGAKGLKSEIDHTGAI
jgi:hypothetical protein